MRLVAVLLVTGVVGWLGAHALSRAPSSGQVHSAAQGQSIVDGARRRLDAAQP